MRGGLHFAMDDATVRRSGLDDGFALRGACPEGTIQDVREGVAAVFCFGFLSGEFRDGSDGAEFFVERDVFHQVIRFNMFGRTGGGRVAAGGERARLAGKEAGDGVKAVK